MAEGSRSSTRERKPTAAAAAAAAEERRGMRGKSSTNTTGTSKTNAEDEDQKPPVTPARKTSASRSQSKGASGATGSATKAKRRKVNHACVYCRRSHMTCDLARPCARCIKRDIGHLCHDEPREGGRKVKPDPDGVAGESDMTAVSALESPINTLASVRPAVGLNLAQLPSDQIAGSSGVVQPTPVHAAAPGGVIGTPLAGLSTIPDWLYSPFNQAGDMHSLLPSYAFNTSEVSNEYSLLGDIVSSGFIDENMFPGSEDPSMAAAPLTDPMLNAPLEAVNAHLYGTANRSMTQMPPPSAIVGKTISRPASGFPGDKEMRESYLMTAADPAGSEAPEERLQVILKAKYDTGLLRPYNYVKGYARMSEYLKGNLADDSQAKILKQLRKFRPLFRERIQKLTDYELTMVEIEFDKRLMWYERVFASMAIPACCWRRTGEIYRANNAMAKLLAIPMERLRDGKMAIHEIFAEKSLVEYWKCFGVIAFNSQNRPAIFTTVVLNSPNPDAKEKEIECCFTFTIQKDKHDIPSLIVGNFLRTIPRSSS